VSRSQLLMTIRFHIDMNGIAQIHHVLLRLNDTVEASIQRNIVVADAKANLLNDTDWVLPKEGLHLRPTIYSLKNSQKL
jgi:hypothetical protein